MAMTHLAAANPGWKKTRLAGTGRPADRFLLIRRGHNSPRTLALVREIAYSFENPSLQLAWCAGWTECSLSTQVRFNS
jgi:hypothetical protein